MKKARLSPGWYRFETTPLGLEPRIKEPKSLVLPITPRSNHFLTKIGSATDLVVEVYTLSTSLTTGDFLQIRSILQAYPNHSTAACSRRIPQAQEFQRPLQVFVFVQMIPDSLN